MNAIMTMLLFGENLIFQWGGRQKSKVSHLKDRTVDHTSVTAVNITDYIITDPQEQANLMGGKMEKSIY